MLPSPLRLPPPHLSTLLFLPSSFPFFLTLSSFSYSLLPLCSSYSHLFPYFFPLSGFHSPLSLFIHPPSLPNPSVAISFFLPYFSSLFPCSLSILISLFSFIISSTFFYLLLFLSALSFPLFLLFSYLLHPHALLT